MLDKKKKDNLLIERNLDGACVEGKHDGELKKVKLENPNIITHF